MHIDKKPLPLDQYQDYQISQEYQAYIITLLNITQEEMDNYESDLMSKREKLFHADMCRVDGDKFNATLIVGVASTYSGFKN